MQSHRIKYLVGVDIGSTTIKAVARVFGGDREDILWQDYQRHDTRQPEKLLELLACLERKGIRAGNSRIFFTGSGAGNLAQHVGARFVQEVHAVAMAVEAHCPEARSVVELGGQDAKIIVYKPDSTGHGLRKVCSMNDKCAGGTGAVIEKIAAKLQISGSRLRRIPYQGVRLHPVAAKCGVFAETDINSLHKSGVGKDELMASLFEAIVAQNLSVLARGHTLRPRVVLLGGPNTFFRGMQEAWRANILRLWAERAVEVPPTQDLEELIVAPEDGHYFAALGAIELARSAEAVVGLYQGTEALQEYLRNGNTREKLRSGSPALVGSREEKEAFAATFRRPPFRPSTFAPGETVPALVGIDAGSTSTKAVLLSPRKRVLCKAYQLSAGNPIQETIQMFEQLRGQVEAQGASLQVLGVATTGYAKDIIGKVIQADSALVETAAHARSALTRYQDVDVIVDVGGQDIKLILLKDGRVKDFLLNTQCSAGNGYFLQSTVEGFGHTVHEYAEMAFSARRMPAFNYGCAVFLQSDLVNFQRQGWRPEEILAGLAAVLPRNIWLYVAKIPNPARLGRRFVLQGGTQNNLAAVKAQVDFILERCQDLGPPPEIIVHEHCGEAGAIGAALEALRLWEEGRQTTFIGLDAVRGIRYRTTHSEQTRCPYCANHCERIFIDFQLGRKAGGHFPTSGERLIIASCEKGTVQDIDSVRGIRAGMESVKRENPNLIEFAAREVWKSPLTPIVSDSIPARQWSRSSRRRAGLMRDRRGIRIGIPRVLDLYHFAPVFSGYLQSLGVPPAHLIYSDFTTPRMFAEGNRRGTIDPCFPSKIVNAHVHNLVTVQHRRQPLDFIFLPMLDVLATHLVNMVGQNACPTVTLTPQAVKASFTKERDVFAENGIRYLNPLLNLADRKLFAHQMLGLWQPILGLSGEENERAVNAGFRALQEYEDRVRRRAREVLDRLEREDRLGIVLLGRPYHHDPGVHHGIPEELQKLGYAILSQSTLPVDADLLDRLFGPELELGIIQSPLEITDVWKNAYAVGNSQKLWGAKFAARHPNLVALEISSFKCGHDAPIYSVVEDIIEYSGTPFFSFRDIDENKPAGSIRLRIETIDYFLTRYREQRFGPDRRKRSSPISGRKGLSSGGIDNRKT